MHAGWNLLAKGQRSEGSFFAGLLGWGVLLGFVPAVLSEIGCGFMPATAWLCVIFSGCCAAAYFFFLAKGYGASDFTVVYPVARALPVLLVGLGDVIWGRAPSTLGWVGMSLVAAGCLLTPLRSFGDIHWRRYIHWPSLWMVLAALGTVGYSLSDKMASEVVSSGAASAARYCYFFFLTAFIAYQVMWRLFAKKAQRLQKTKHSTAILGAVLNFSSYWMIVWAYQIVGRASYVVAFRQFSIVLGVVAAFVIYRERGLAVRVCASVIITVGLVLIGVWG